MYPQYWPILKYFYIQYCCLHSQMMNPLDASERPVDLPSGIVGWAVSSFLCSCTAMTSESPLYRTASCVTKKPKQVYK